MARLTAVAVVALTTSGAQTQCSTGDPGAIDSGPTFVTTLQLKDAAGVSQNRFARGEVITLQLTVRNRSPQPVDVDFVDGQQFDFFVFRSGTGAEQWRWSSTAIFTQAATTLSFGAGETRTFSVNWPASVAAGAYEARGALIFDGLRARPLTPHELGSALVSFNVD